MRVLVTGGAGFIGSHLVERLLEHGHHVSVLDDFNDFYDPALKRENLTAVQGRGDLTINVGDIRNRQLVMEVIAREKPEAIAHLAARAGVGPSLREPELYLEVNVGGTYAVLEAARQAGIGHFVFASSSSVYGNDSPTPFQEEAAADRPISPYGATKRMGEVLAYSFHGLYGMPVTMLRLFTAYGARCRPDLAVHKFSRLMVNGQPIPVYGNGRARRDFTYVNDLVEGLVKAVERPRGFEVINLGYGRPITVLKLISLLENRLGARAKIEFQPPQPGDVDITYASIDRAKQLLDWQPTTPIEHGLDLWCQWFLSHRSVDLKT